MVICSLQCIHFEQLETKRRRAKGKKAGRPIRGAGGGLVEETKEAYIFYSYFELSMLIKDICKWNKLVSFMYSFLTKDEIFE